MRAHAIKGLFDGLKPVQREMFALFLRHESGRKYVIHCSRRLGKTYLLCVLAIVYALSNAHAQVRYASVSQKAVRKMIHPICKELFSALPAGLRGKWNGHEGAYIFANGSMIHVAGVNNGHEDDLRGTSADLAVVDEAGFVDNLSYLVESVLMPQLITTGGRLVMASSSPLSPAHEFAEYVQAARAGGYYSSFDIFAGGYEPEVVEEFLKEAGGRESTTARREYLNELIVDSEMAIIPEWRPELAREVPPDEFRGFYHNYSAMDIGVRDKTAVLWGYYDFRKATLVVEGEWTTSGQDTTTRNIAAAVRAKELELRYEKVYRRPADNNNLILLQDLASAEHGRISFFPTGKEALAAMVNEVRLMVADGRVIVHPRCQELIGCLTYGVYADGKRKEFGRSKSFGHFDALAALVYLVRNLDTHTNPVPAAYGLDLRNSRIRERPARSEGARLMGEIFKKPTKRV